MDTKEKEVKQTLESIDGISPANANPFLYDKIMHRMQSAKQVSILRPVVIGWGTALIVLLVGINVFSLAHYSKKSQQVEARSAFSSEYFSYITNY